MKYLKVLPRWILVAIVLGAVGLGLWTVFDGCEAAKRYFNGSERGVKTVVPPPPEDVGVPASAEPVPVIEDRKTLEEHLTFWVGDTRAEELTKDLPPGTDVYVVTDQDGGQTLIYRTEEGYVYKDGEGAVEAFRTPEPALAVEFRPKVLATTDFSTVGIGAEMDLVRLWDVHLGPSGGYKSNKNGWVGAGGGYNLAKNVDVGGYAGKTLGDEGWSYGLSVGIAIK